MARMEVSSAPSTPSTSTPPRVRYSLRDLRNMSAARAAAARDAEEQSDSLYYSPGRLRMSGIGDFRRSEYSARPLRWLDVTTLYEAATPHSFVNHGSWPTKNAVRLPPLQHKPRQQSLREEDGSPSSCPICLATFSADGNEAETSSDLPKRTNVQWTHCCGHAFHETCIAPLARCPMCRTGLRSGNVHDCSRLSQPLPLRSALDCSQDERRLDGAIGHGSPSASPPHSTGVHSSAAHVSAQRVSIRAAAAQEK